jgi:phosphate transport system substrate-binding protein
MKRVSLIRLSVIILVGAGLGVLVYYSPAFFIKNDEPPAYVHLKTGGTSVAHIIMENRWKTAYRNAKGVEVEYDSTGSTKGVTRMIEGQYAIGFTHAPLTEAQKSTARGKGGEVAHIPVVICAVVPVYNLKGLKGKPPLRFTGEVLADIFRGKIDRWNDPALKQLNEGVDLPDTKIVVVHRKDSSGTTLIFTDFLQGVSPAWKQEVGPAASEVKWPVGVGVARNAGVAEHVRKTEGAIGYVDLLHALLGEDPDLRLTYGAVQNKDKTAFIHAGPENMTAAAKGLAGGIAEDLTFNLTNRPGKDAYPISGVIWAVCYQAQPGSTQQQVVDFLRWITHEGQKFAGTTSYAPLPDELVERVDQKLNAMMSVR